MSRKYCSVCGETHQNGGLGMCDECSEKVQAATTTARHEKADALRAFMSLPEEERWEHLFEVLYAEGVL